MSDALWDGTKEERRRAEREDRANERLDEIKSNLSEDDKQLLEEIVSAVHDYDLKSEFSEPLEEALSIVFYNVCRKKEAAASVLLRERRRLQAASAQPKIQNA